MAIKFLHTADIHLGSKSALGGGQIRRYLCEALKRLVGLAVHEKADLLLIAGDLFDSPRVNTATSVLVTTVLNELTTAGVRVVILPGTHDAYDSSSPYHTIKLPENAHLITPQNPSYLFDDLPGSVFVTGKPYIKASYNENALSGLSPHPQASLNIAMVHGSVVGQVTEDAMLIYPQELAKSGFDYIALGHWHSFREISKKPRAVYPGAMEPTAKDQTGTGRVIVTEFDPVGKTLSTHYEQVGKIRIENLSFRVELLTKPEDLYSLFAQRKDPDLILFLELSGVASPGFTLDREDFLAEYGANFLYLEVINHLQPVEEFSAGDFGERTIAGRFASLVAEEIDKAKSDDERAFLSEVLNEGLRRLGKGADSL